MRLPAPLLLLLSASLAWAYVPATTTTTFNSTAPVAAVEVLWNTASGAGYVAGDLSLLLNGDGKAALTNETSTYGVVLFFNESNIDSSNDAGVPFPFIALISCDGPLTNSTTPLNSTNGTTIANSTGTPANTTQQSQNGTRQDVFSFAASLNATAAILYSNASRACILSPEYLGSNTSHPLPILTPRSQTFSSLLTTQIGYLGANTTTYNSSFLTAIYNNVTIDPSENPLLQAPAGFALGNLTLESRPSNANASGTPLMDGGGPTLATIGHAPSSAPSSGSGNSTGAAGERYRVDVMLLVLALAAAGWTSTALPNVL